MKQHLTEAAERAKGEWGVKNKKKKKPKKEAAPAEEPLDEGSQRAKLLDQLAPAQLERMRANLTAAEIDQYLGTPPAEEEGGSTEGGSAEGGGWPSDDRPAITFSVLKTLLRSPNDLVETVVMRVIYDKLRVAPGAWPGEAWPVGRSWEFARQLQYVARRHPEGGWFIAMLGDLGFI